MQKIVWGVGGETKIYDETHGESYQDKKDESTRNLNCIH